MSLIQCVAGPSSSRARSAAAVVAASAGHQLAPFGAKMTSAAVVTYQSLSCFVQEGNLRGLTLYLASHHSQVDVRDENGQTVLMLACQQGEISFVRELLKHGADANALDNDNWNPLLTAAKEGHDEIVGELLDCGATVGHKDLGHWTALIWACYKGRSNVVKMLLDKGADPNVTGQYHVSCLVWAAGRGYKSIVRQLLNHGAKVNVGDKYGTTALVWASRKGYVEIVDELLQAGANVDTAGMYSWTALLVASRGNYPEVVNLLLDYKPNVNALDNEGCTALTIASKEGHTEVAVALLNAGAYVNMPDRNGDTNLIHATKSGHLEVVEALLKKYADVDVQGADRRTALYWAVEKGHIDIAKAIINAGPDMELATKDGDTALMKATRSRHTELVQLLIERKAKVSSIDKKGDTALHIAMRAHSKTIVELLLRNPKHSQLLYRPNRLGETPYNIDARHQRSILGQIFGARRLNTNEDNENMLGYELYGSALADILSEPSLSMPICLGLYAKWGSGKSFLLGKLRDEMKNFTRQWLEPTFEFTAVSYLVTLFASLSLGIVIGFLCRMWLAGVVCGVGVFLITHIFLALIRYGCERHDWRYCYEMSVYLARKTQALRIFLQVLFCHPPQKLSIGDGSHAQRIRFLFTDQTKVSGSGGDANVAQMVSSLYTALEDEYGTLTTRLYTVFKPKPVPDNKWKWRRLCCVPNFFLFVGLLLCMLGGAVLLGLFLLNPETMGLGSAAGTAGKDGSEEESGNGSGDREEDEDDETEGSSEDGSERYVVEVVLIALACVLAVAVVANLYTIVKALAAVCYPRKRRVVRLGYGGGGRRGRDGGSKGDTQLQPLRSNIQLMSEMVKCLDGFTGNQTRLVVIVDGLDSCEQDKVLHNLDAVHLLFSDLGAPFIILLAIDPHVIIKAIEVNIHRVFHDSSISGHSYLRNIVHLPFYLQNAGLRRVKVAQKTVVSQRKSHGGGWTSEEAAAAAATARRLSSESSMSIPERVKQLRTNSSTGAGGGPASTKGSKKLRPSDSIASSVGNVGRSSGGGGGGGGGAHDLTKVLLTDDYFSDVNPRSMRRLMNVMYITGRLLKAFNIDFNWYHLASWVNITEQWPYRTSWIIFYYETNEEAFDDNCSLKSIYDKIHNQIPTSKDVEPLLEIDRDERKFEVFLTFHKASLHVSDIKVFLPFTINLDPYIRKAIREDQQAMEEMARLDVAPGPMGHPWLTAGAPPTAPMLQDGRMTHRRAAANNAAGAKGAVMAPAPAWLYPYSSPPGMLVPTAPPSIWAPGPPAPGSAGAPPSVAVMPPSTQASAHNENAALVKQAPVAQMLFSGQALENLSVSGVCELLSAVEGISAKALQRYKETLRDSNIHGKVLVYCDMDELKKVMGMSFGDWELFRMNLMALRDKTGEWSAAHPSVRFAKLAAPPQQPDEADAAPPVSEHREAVHVSAAGDRRGSKVAEEIVSDGGRPSAPRDKNLPVKRHTSSSSTGSGTNMGTIQKQVTMEDQMIMGALQSLNEEAEVDARHKRRTGSDASTTAITGSVAASGTGNAIPLSSPLSPILSNPEEEENNEFEDCVQVSDSDATSRGLRTPRGPYSDYGDDFEEDDDECDENGSDDDADTEVLYLRSHPASPHNEDDGGPRQDRVRVVDPPGDVTSGWNDSNSGGGPQRSRANTNASSVIEMDHVAEWNERSARALSRAVYVSSDAGSPQPADNHLNRLRKLLSSSNGNSRGGRPSSDSPVNYDSDTENSESAPLVTDRFPPPLTTVNWVANGAETSEQDAERSNVATLGIDAAHFRQFRTVPSWPDVGGALVRGSPSAAPRSVQTSPVKVPVTRRTWAASGAGEPATITVQFQQPGAVSAATQQQQQTPHSQDLIEMLGGNETVL